MKYLIPIDGSPSSDRAIEYGIKMANKMNVELVVLTVCEPFETIELLRFMTRQECEDALKASRRHDMERIVDLLFAAGIQGDAHIEIGPVAETIALTATVEDCDGIIMGTRGHGLVAGFILGSVATKVVHLTRLPVTLIH